MVAPGRSGWVTPFEDPGRVVDGAARTPMPDRHAQVLAREEGISPTTLKRAKKQLGVMPQRQDFQAPTAWHFQPMKTIPLNGDQ